ncbi:ATP-binding protein [Flammeovirga aprica]|uniref:ATP-binding protein n=1 Tax=Flammeovirga aprica JL-4 TaxID=694437 RepID=A0A7X9RZN2_9BACT|nr:ATP-binding protein [Flammeovirga aprica]NME71557.1 ATP-binding protein [Flammeovirga aprica JL-4]
MILNELEQKVNLSIHQTDFNTILDALCTTLLNTFDQSLNLGEAEIELHPESHVSQMVEEFQLDTLDLKLIALAYAWEYDPALLKSLADAFSNRDLRQLYGGTLDKDTANFYPTLKTFLALFYSKDEYQNALLKYTSIEYPLTKYGILSYSDEGNIGESNLNHRVQLASNYVSYLLGGKRPQLDHEYDFPARLLTSKVPFDKIVHDKETREGLEDLQKYMKVRPILKNNPSLKKKLNNTHIIIFSGSPGTGKSLTATSLGEAYHLPTYTLDLSRVLSRYVGDFEKAMEKVFSRLDGRDCILFIDEADSIFTKRQEEVKDTKDKYANQEMSYLLQRLERFDGVVILATNVQDIRTHLDKAMLRRISTIVEFPFPKQQQRLELWQNAIPEGFTFGEGVLDKLSANFQLSGANISNIISGVIIEALSINTTELTYEMIEPIMKKEYYKRDSRFMACPDNSPAAALMEQRLGRTAVHSGRRM